MTLRTTLAAGALALAAAGTAQAASVGMGYSLGNNGQTLVIIGNVADPVNVTSTSITDGAGRALSLSELTIRPLTGQLYGYSDEEDTVYLVNPRTGVATAQVVSGVPTSEDAVGFDFNPQVDKARIVTASNQNLVYTPTNSPVPGNANTVVAATNLFYANGDVNGANGPNKGKDPAIFANAYTNSLAEVLATQTTQYVLDHKLDILATLANNTGVLTTVASFTLGGVKFDFTETGGFDILTSVGGLNTAYAILTGSGGQRLFSFDPSLRGQIALTDLGAISGGFGPLRGFAVGPSAVPLPAGGVLLLGALAGLGLLRRRKSA